jgi:hypothetical protein
MNPDHTFAPYFFNTHYILSTHLRLGLRSGFFPSDIFYYNVVCISNAYINYVCRLCWIAATLACAVLGVVFINSAWDNFCKVPIIVNVETTNYPLYKLPFPAITVCPAVNVKKTIGENLLARYCLTLLITAGLVSPSSS